ncbi:MAG: FAD-dependent oxidoreductase [Rhodobacteraceae bacterium]|nr:FAD-dependent oxidoreductase [Paracoccaceae bacterium]
MVDVTIIGAGVVGLCVARVLCDLGAQVSVVDRGDAPGPQACSWWAGGMLAPYCEGESAEEPVVRLGQEAAAWWQDKTNAVQRHGSLVLSLTRDHADLRLFARRTDHFVNVDQDQIAALEPDLGGRFNKGLFFESEAHLAPRAALAVLHADLINDGVTFTCQEVDPSDFSKQGLTIDCRGYGAKPDLADLRGVKGEMLLLSCPDMTLSRPIRLLHPRIPLYIVPRGDGVFMLGATMIESSASRHVTARALLEMLSAAYALNPAFGEAEVLEIGVDTRPAFADNLPRIRKCANLITVNGLYRHGFLLAPAVARMVGALIFDNIKPEVMDEHSA